MMTKSGQWPRIAETIAAASIMKAIGPTKQCSTFLREALLVLGDAVRTVLRQPVRGLGGGEALVGLDAERVEDLVERCLVETGCRRPAPDASIGCPSSSHFSRNCHIRTPHPSTRAVGLVAGAGGGVHRVEAGEAAPRSTSAMIQASIRSCSAASSATSAASACGMTTAPSRVGDDQVVGEDRDAAAADRLLPADEGQPGDRGRRGGAAAQTGRPVPSTPSRSRTTPSVTRAATLRSPSGRRGCRRRCRRR